MICADPDADPDRRRRQLRLSPTGANIRTTLRGMLEDREAEDTVLVALAGHGVKFRDSEVNYFCPMDARLADRRTLVSLEEVYQQMERSQAGVKVLLVDACRNDPQSDNSRSRSVVSLESVTRPQLKPPPGGVAALFSCSPGEKAFEHERLKHGIFYHFVIEGLKGRAVGDGDGQVDVEELARYAKRNVSDFVKEEYGFDVRQMPVLKGEIGGLAALVGRDRPVLPERTSPRPVPDAEKTITNTIGMKLALIPAGEFLMGSPDSHEAYDWEMPRHRVRITRPFYLGVHEVTQGQYRSA